MNAGELPVTSCGDIHVYKFVCAIPCTHVYSIEYTCIQLGTHAGANAYTHVYSYMHTQVFGSFQMKSTRNIGQPLGFC